MPTKSEKEAIILIGGMIIIASIAFFAYDTLLVQGNLSPAIKNPPFSQYIIPMGLLGILVVVLGLALPATTPRESRD